MNFTLKGMPRLLWTCTGIIGLVVCRKRRHQHRFRLSYLMAACWQTSQTQESCVTSRRTLSFQASVSGLMRIFRFRSATNSCSAIGLSSRRYSKL